MGFGSLMRFVEYSSTVEMVEFVLSLKPLLLIKLKSK